MVKYTIEQLRVEMAALKKAYDCKYITKEIKE